MIGEFRRHFGKSGHHGYVLSSSITFPFQDIVWRSDRDLGGKSDAEKIGAFDAGVPVACDRRLQGGGDHGCSVRVPYESHEKRCRIYIRINK